MNIDIYKLTYPKVMCRNRDMVTSLHPYRRDKASIKELNDSSNKLRMPKNHDDEVMLNPRLFEFLMKKMEEAQNNRKLTVRRKFTND